ncbi:MAG: carbohydrate ABC transporter permease [Eubacteriales bacterium]
MHKANAHIFPDPSDEKSTCGPVISDDSSENGDTVTGTSYEDFTGPALPAEDEPVIPEEAAETPPYSAPERIRMNPFSTMTRSRITYNISMTIFFIIASIVAVFSLMPIVLTILNSFMSTKEIVTNYSAVFSSLSSNVSDTKTYLSTEAHLKLIPDMASLEQYATVLFKSPTYLIKFWNSVALVVPIVVFQMAVGSFAAYSFARYRRKRREVLFFSYIILMLMPFQVTLVPNYLIAQQLGILNTPQAIILPGIFSTFSVFLLSKYMRQIPSSYIEAAKLDGAGEWHIFTAICMPMCKSALYAMGILLFIDYWNMVEQPLVLLTDPDKQPLSVFLAEINSGEVGIAFAASFIFMIPPLLIFLNGEQYLIEGISRSGIK